MAFSSAGRSGPLADINVTPLVDVMLVLLIIFIVTAPIVARPIAVQLPQATDRVVDRPEPPPPIELRLDANGAFDPATALAALEQFARFDVARHAVGPVLPGLDAERRDLRVRTGGRHGQARGADEREGALGGGRDSLEPGQGH